MGESTTGVTGISGSKQQTVLARWFYNVVYFFKFRQRWRNSLWNTVILADCPLCDSEHIRTIIYSGEIGEDYSIGTYEAMCMGCGEKILIEIKAQRLIKNKK